MGAENGAGGRHLPRYFRYPGPTQCDVMSPIHLGHRSAEAPEPPTGQQACWCRSPTRTSADRPSGRRPQRVGSLSTDPPAVISTSVLARCSQARRLVTVGMGSNPRSGSPTPAARATLPVVRNGPGQGVHGRHARSEPGRQCTKHVRRVKGCPIRGYQGPAVANRPRRTALRMP